MNLATHRHFMPKNLGFLHNESLNNSTKRHKAMSNEYSKITQSLSLKSIARFSSDTKSSIKSTKLTKTKTLAKTKTLINPQNPKQNPKIEKINYIDEWHSIACAGGAFLVALAILISICEMSTCCKMK